MGAVVKKEQASASRNCLERFFIQGCYDGHVDRTCIYIDGNNLYRSAKILGYRIDYRKLHG